MVALVAVCHAFEVVNGRGVCFLQAKKHLAAAKSFTMVLIDARKGMDVLGSNGLVRLVSCPTGVHVPVHYAHPGTWICSLF